jgi:hydrogenase assembly chaperone HypC/HupF
MCVAYPAQVLAVGPDATALVSVRGREQRVLLLALDDPLATGDWLLVQSGIALARIDAGEAAEQSRLLHELTGDPP